MDSVIYVLFMMRSFIAVEQLIKMKYIILLRQSYNYKFLKIMTITRNLLNNLSATLSPVVDNLVT